MSRLLFSLFVIAIGVPAAYAQDTFLNKTAGAWAVQLRSNDAADRRKAAYALGKMSTRAMPVIKDMKVALRGEKDARVRETLLFALGEICRDTTGAANDRDLEPLFIAALKDDRDAYVRRSAAFAVGCLASESEASYRALEVALMDSEAIVRQNAAWALARQGDIALPALRKALHDADSFVKRDAAAGLMRMKDADKVHELLKDLLPCCKDSNSEVRRAALNVLVRIVDAKDKQAIPDLKAALDDADSENKINAALALSNIGGPESAAAVPTLVEALRSNDVELRRQAAASFHHIGPAAKSAVKGLIAALRDDADEEVRRNAAVSLGGIGKDSEPAIPLLLAKLIKDTKEDHLTRVYCGKSLQKIGAVPKATEIVPEILAFMTDMKQDSEIRMRSNWALRVHNVNLRTLPGVLDAYRKVMKEPATADNKMLRYDVAYMVGSVWRDAAPPEALDLLGALLMEDEKFAKIIAKTTSGVGGASAESGTGRANVKENFEGDARVMAADALQSIGARRYGQRADIMRQLRKLAVDPKADPPLRNKAAELVDAVLP